MRRRLSFLIPLLVSALEILPRGAHAQIPVLPQWWDGFQRQTVTPAQPFPVTDVDRDRNFAGFTALFTGQTLVPPNTATPNQCVYQMNQPRYVGQFSRVSLMLNYGYTAQADSDSTAIMVRVYGMESINAGTRYLWTPQNQINAVDDSCHCNATVADSASATTTRCIQPPPTFIVLRQASNPPLELTMGILGGGNTATNQTRGHVRKLPSWSIRYGGANGIVIPLVDEGGAPIPFPWITVEVYNLRWTGAANSLMNVAGDAWVRVF